ncbi:MAG: DUF3343 domain-containing protein [Clostridia bacterium]|nr:DUF3343 domain-containing protein [Clostridia bacterium]
MITIDRFLIVFSSATTATRVKNELTKNKISAKVVQTPKALSKSGCSYSVKAPESALFAAESAATALGVKIKNIYREKDNDYELYR